MAEKRIKDEYCSDELQELISSVNDMQDDTNLLFQNFKQMFLELSTDN